MDPKIKVAAAILKLVGELLETRPAEDLLATLERLRDHGTTPITPSTLDDIDAGVIGPR